MSTIKDLLEPLKKRIKEHANHEFGCHEHYQFSGLARLIEAVEVLDKAIEEHHNTWRLEGEYCLSECSVVCIARAAAAKILANDGGRDV